jgi:hypothetical protein
MSDINFWLPPEDDNTVQHLGPSLIVQRRASLFTRAQLPWLIIRPLHWLMMVWSRCCTILPSHAAGVISKLAPLRCLQDFVNPTFTLNSVVVTTIKSVFASLVRLSLSKLETKLRRYIICHYRYICAFFRFSFNLVGQYLQSRNFLII